MTISTTTQRLAAMYQLIPGINKAFAYVPRILSPAQLPAIVIEPGEATDFRALTDATNVVVKVPGALNDKFIV